MPEGFKQIGTVEILRLRTYALDPQNKEITATEAIVDPGIYPLFSDGYTTLWLMTGRLNGDFMRRGDGMFIGYGGDLPLDNLIVTFPSPFFGPDEWKELLSYPVAIEGNPDQRLRITINEE